MWEGFCRFCVDLSRKETGTVPFLEIESPELK
jgi:hypothetical protein